MYVKKKINECKNMYLSTVINFIAPPVLFSLEKASKTACKHKYTVKCADLRVLAEAKRSSLSLLGQCVCVCVYACQ